MKIAIDHDGTAMLYPEVYRPLIASLRKAGHHVGIITGRTAETQEKDVERLHRLGFRLDFFWNSGEMNHEELDLIEKAEAGKLKLDRDTVCCMWKARMCEERNVDLLVDDNADSIRLFQNGGKTLILKSPTPDNMVVMKWGKHELNYD